MAEIGVYVISSFKNPGLFCCLIDLRALAIFFQEAALQSLVIQAFMAAEIYEKLQILLFSVSLFCILHPQLDTEVFQSLVRVLGFSVEAVLADGGGGVACCGSIWF